MKITKTINIDNNVKANFIIDVETKTSGWILHVFNNGKTIQTKASASTILALMMAEREFKAYSTEFYEIGDF